MNINHRRPVALLAGTGAVCATVGASLVGLALPAAAATDYTTCSEASAAATDGTVNSALNAKNIAALATFKRTTAFKAKHAKVVSATASLAAAKRSKNAVRIARATKVRAAAVAAEARAVVLFKKANYVSSTTGTVTPAAVLQDSVLRSWGTYRTRVYVKAGSVVAGGICTSVDETGVSPTDQVDSRTTYQAGVMPSMRTAALSGARTSSVAILARVSTEVVTNLGGAASPIGVGTGASYSVDGFYHSLQSALTKAKL